MDNNPKGLSLEEAVEAYMAPAEDTPDEEQTDDVSEVEEAEDPTEEVEDDQPDDDGSEEDETEDEDTAEEDPEIQWETASGETLKAKLSELQSGYLRHQDYTRKTQEVAENRKAFETKQAEYAEKITQLEDQLSQWAVQTQQEPDWAAAAQQMDPREYNLARLQWENQQRRRQEAQQEYIRLKDETTKTKFQDDAEKLKEALPDLRDEAKAPLVLNDISLAAQTLGYSREDLARIDDHRIFLGLNMIAKQMKAEQQKGETKKVVDKKVAKVPPAMTPGGKSDPKRVKEARKRDDLRARLKKTGSEDAALELLMLGRK